MTEKSVIELAHIVFSKISNCYGYSKYQKLFPYLDIEDSPYSDADTSSFGEFIASENSLVIYWKNIQNPEDLIRTILHEYQHYLQRPSWYTRYANKFSYNENPYEISAYNEEEKWKTFQ